MRFCNNLRSGVPLCIVSGFFEDWDEEFEQALMVMSEAEARVKFSRPIVEHCSCVVRSDMYGVARPDFKKSACFFGGLCVRPMILGFGGCSADCPRWKDVSE